MIEGPSVGELRILFDEVFRGKRIRPLHSKPARKLKKPLSFINTFPREKPNRLHQMLLHLVEMAKSEILMNQIYFVPDKKILHSLYDAVGRGVRVQLLLSRKSDLNVVQSAVKYYISDLLAHGVEVYWYEPCVNHSKTWVIDGRYSVVGSANIDGRSFTKNYEITAIMTQREFAQEMIRMYELDLKQSTKQELADWQKNYRIWGKLCGRAALVLRPFL